MTKARVITCDQAKKNPTSRQVGRRAALAKNPSGEKKAYAKKTAKSKKNVGEYGEVFRQTMPDGSSTIVVRRVWRERKPDIFHVRVLKGKGSSSQETNGKNVLFAKDMASLKEAKAAGAKWVKSNLKSRQVGRRAAIEKKRYSVRVLQESGAWSGVSYHASMSSAMKAASSADVESMTWAIFDGKKKVKSNQPKKSKRNPSDLPTPSLKFRMKRAAAEAGEKVKASAKSAGSKAAAATKLAAQKAGRKVAEVAKEQGSKAAAATKAAAKKAGAKAAEKSKQAAVWTGKKVAAGGKRAGRKLAGTAKEGGKAAWEGLKKGWKENPTSRNRQRRTSISMIKGAIEAGVIYLGESIKGKHLSVGPYHTATAKDAQYALVIGNSPHILPSREAAAQFIAMAKPETVRLANENPAKSTKTTQAEKKRESRYPRHPSSKDEQYVDYDDETGSWGVFGSESGFCHATFATEEQANKYLKENFPKLHGKKQEAYPKMPKRSGKEEYYVDHDEDTDSWGIFGSSGFCYATFSTKAEANRYLKESFPKHVEFHKKQHQSRPELQSMKSSRRNPSKRKPRQPAGTPTDLNIHVMKQELAKGGGVIRGVDATAAPHLRRCIKAGLLVSDGAGGWVAKPGCSNCTDGCRDCMPTKNPAKKSKTFLAWTNAPKSYDYWYVEETGTVVNTPHGEFRLVRVNDKERWDTFQLGRYQSGWKVAFPASDKKRCETFGLPLKPSVPKQNPAKGRKLSKEQQAERTREAQYPRHPRSDDEQYVDYDDETGSYGVFGTHSGFCYATFATKEEADRYLNKMFPEAASGYWRNRNPVGTAIVKVPSLTAVCPSCGTSAERLPDERGGYNWSCPSCESGFGIGTRTGLIPAVSITLTGKGDPHEVSGGEVWNKANVLLSLWGRESKESEKTKVSFHIRYADGETYSGTYTVSRTDQVTGDLGRHVRMVLEAAAGKKKPPHMTLQQYKKQLTKIPTEKRQDYVAFLAKYEVGCSRCEVKSNPTGKTLHVIPAYGRDYKSKAQRLDSLLASQAIHYTQL